MILLVLSILVLVVTFSKNVSKGIFMDISEYLWHTSFNIYQVRII